MYANAGILIPALTENADADEPHDTNSNASIYIKNL